MVPRTKVYLSTACQDIIANEKRLSRDQDRIFEERERCRRVGDASVGKMRLLRVKFVS